MSFKSFTQQKWVRIPYFVVIYAFALYGMFLVATYVAMKFQWTNESGSVDENNRYYQNMHDKYNQSFKVDSVSMMKHRYEILNRVLLLNNYYPANAERILSIYEKSGNEKLALQMIDAAELHLLENKAYQNDKKKLLVAQQASEKKVSGLSAFEWMNITEWKYFRQAVARDKKYIDSAAAVSGVEARIIVACLVGEQVRMFNSRRERFKNMVAPLKSLVLETNQSYGVTGIKDQTAAKIEAYLKDKKSPYYLGEKYETILDYDSTITYSSNKHNDSLNMRLKRLVQYDNHYFSYLYAALFVRQIKMQWERAGFPIDERPEILASLFNLGFHKSKPKKNPAVGGSNFNILEKSYTFGGVAFDFYYSGELSDIFPYEDVKFKP
jgi:hypothetical protein